MKRFYNPTPKNGFSLIELMVVVSIIGILMALGAVSYTTAQKKARDATRKGDIRALQDAMEQYYVANSSTYPTSGDCGELDDTSDFLPGSFPSDPKPAPWPDYSRTCVATGDSYCICAQLESDTGNASDGSCTYGSGDYFCVTNQQ